MTSLLSRAIASVRVWVGLNDPAENRPYPSHGWLLPPSDARVLAPAKVLSPALVTLSGKRG